MGRTRKGTAAIVGLVVGLVTLRSLRKRRSTEKGQEASEVTTEHEEPAEMGHEAPETATGHAAAAAEHARVAAAKAAESAREDT